MNEFTKKLFTFGGSLAVVIPHELVELYDLQKGDFVALYLKDYMKGKE